MLPMILLAGLLSATIPSVRAVPPPHPIINNDKCHDNDGNIIDCPGSLVIWIISLSIAGVVVIGIIIALAYPKCKRRIKERKAKASSSSQKYQKLDEPVESAPDIKTTTTEHNPDAPYDPPVNSLPYSYPSEYTPPEISYAYNPPPQPPVQNPEPVQFPTAQVSSSANTPPTYEPPTYAPHMPA